MIIKLKSLAQFHRLSKQWGLWHFKQNKSNFELYLFKWGIAYLYVISNKDILNILNQKSIDDYKSWLLTEGAIEIEEISETKVKIGGKRT